MGRPGIEPGSLAQELETLTTKPHHLLLWLADWSICKSERIDHNLLIALENVYYFAMYSINTTYRLVCRSQICPKVRLVNNKFIDAAVYITPEADRCSTAYIQQLHLYITHFPHFKNKKYKNQEGPH